MRSRIVRALIVASAVTFIVVIAFSPPNAPVPERENDIVVFSPAQPGFPIVVPSRAIPVERHAAELVQRTLANPRRVPRPFR